MFVLIDNVADPLKSLPKTIVLQTLVIMHVVMIKRTLKKKHVLIPLRISDQCLAKIHLEICGSEC